MPDCHAGNGCTIGTTIILNDKVIPDMVSADIGCGMLVANLGHVNTNYASLDNFIRNSIPSGTEINVSERLFPSFDNLRCRKFLSRNKVLRSLGSLGSGNHFLEADRDDSGNLYIVIHTGSRCLGAQVNKFYQDEGFKQVNGHSLEIANEIRKLKSEGRQSEIQSVIKEMKRTFSSKHIPKSASYVSDNLFGYYIDDMIIAQDYASLNRYAIAKEIVRFITGKPLTNFHCFESLHNYIEVRKDGTKIARKGATSARLGEKVIIPLNMRDGSIIGTGKGNPDWNYSAPHGAGRVLSRSAAKDFLSMSDYKKSMEGIFTTSVSESTLDEAPMVYKSPEEIICNTEPTIDIDLIIKPEYNFKASEQLRPLGR
jgi:RNA-splicing ligase RtcB